MITKLNYELDLVNFADCVCGKPYIWGETDCCALALRCIGIMTDFDAAQFIGWNDEKSAMQFAQEYGDLWKTEFNMRSIKPMSCVTGDFLIADKALYPRAHVMIGTHLLSSNVDDGVFLVKYDRHVTGFAKGYSIRG